MSRLQKPSQEDERLWLEQSLHGNPDGFMHLIEVYQRSVFNMCYRMLGNREDAEDAAQETFLRAYQNLKKYDQDRSFITWLLSIAAHFCIDQLRKKRAKIVSMEDILLGEIPDPNPSPERVIVQQDDQLKVQNILQQISEQDRAALILYYWYEFSYEEISIILGFSVSAVKSRLHRAKKEMATLWVKQSSIMKSEVGRKQYEAPVV